MIAWRAVADGYPEYQAGINLPLLVRYISIYGNPGIWMAWFTGYKIDPLLPGEEEPAPGWEWNNEDGGPAEVTHWAYIEAPVPTGLWPCRGKPLYAHHPKR